MKVITRRRAVALSVLVAVVASVAIVTATAATAARSASIQVCALLPDTKSSTRYTLFDAPLLKAAFAKAHVPAQVLNAQGDPQRQKSQAEQCLASGAKVILLDQLDPASGTAITNEAVGQAARVIDYDRLVVGSKASYYVSFDNVKVGRLQGQGLVAALKANGTYSQHPQIAELNGGIQDNNAHLFKKGYDSVLNPLYKHGVLKKIGDQWTDWDPNKGLTIFEQMLAKTNNNIGGVLAANDGLAGAVVSALQNHGLKPLPLTGQDATPTGVQYIIAGWQSGTVYKAIKPEANAAAAAAIAIVRGNPVHTNGVISGTKSILLTPLWVTKKNYKILFSDNFVKRSQVCVGKFAQYCK
jgi:D-xylose transport system substrate-binding protein